LTKDCGEKLKKADLPQKVMVSYSSLAGVSLDSVYLSTFQIDCSHGNSQKQYKKQLKVVNDIVSLSHLLLGHRYSHPKAGEATLLA